MLLVANMGARISSENEVKSQNLTNIQLDDIPNEIVLKILKNVDIWTLSKCAQVCKRINAITNDQSLWVPSLFHVIDFSTSNELPLTKVL